MIRHLTAIIFDRRISDVWSSEYLRLVQRIMNAKVHDTIGVSPAELVFGIFFDAVQDILVTILLQLICCPKFYKQQSFHYELV